MVPWAESVVESQNQDMIFIIVLQALSLGKDLLESHDNDKDYEKNLEKLENLQYLSVKGSRSNINSPQCISFKCQKAVQVPISDSDSAIPFAVNFTKIEQSKTKNVEGNKDFININLPFAQLAVTSLGRILIYFNAYVIIEIVKSLCARCAKSFNSVLESSAKLKSLYNLAKELDALDGMLKSKEFNKEMFNKYETILVDKKAKKSQVILELHRFLFYAQIQNNKTSLHYLEKLLIQLLGHYNFDIRDQAIVFLNMLYDNIDWQFGSAFDPKITSVQSDFCIEEVIRSKTPLNYAILLLSAPAFYSDCPATILTWHPVEVSADPTKTGSYMVKAKFKKFWRCGFYDWKFVEVSSTGKIMMLRKVIPGGKETFAQGRFIVHPEGISEQQIHEVVVDYKSSDDNTEKNFYSLAEEIPNYAKMGINCLYLMGALERDNGVEVDEETGEVIEVRRVFASPLAIIDRSTISRLLGGDSAYRKVIEAANKSKMKLLIDCMARVSSARPHRKYIKCFLHTLDAEGRITFCYGTDGRSVNYEDTAILNYRKLKSWNLLVEDTIKAAEKYKVSGIHLDNAQTWPVILGLNEEELLRKDPDGKPAYTDKEILDGDIVKQCEGQGYWDSTCLERYPNPIFIKLCRELWARFPDFLIVGECLGGALLENRQAILARSGVVPRLFKLPVALASLFGKRLMKDGRVISCKPEGVGALKNWYENSRRFTPEGSYLIQSSSSHIWPYPALLYGRGAWTSVDVLFFMPDVPMTFMGEITGCSYRRKITSVYQARPMPAQAIKRANSQLHLAIADEQEDEEEKKQAPSPVQSPAQAGQEKKVTRVKSMISLSALSSAVEIKKREEEVIKQLATKEGFDLNKIHLHYENRRKLRNERAVLKYGQLVMLEAKHSEGVHQHVIAFARFLPSETAVIAINLTDHNVSFYIDMSELLPLIQKHYPPNIVVMFSDWFNDKDYEYYFINELITERTFFTLSPFSSLCRGMVITKRDSYAYAVALDKSAARVNDRIIKRMDCSCLQLCLQLFETLKNFGSLNDFAMRLIAIIELYAIPNRVRVHTLLVNSFLTSNDTQDAGRCLEYCKKLMQYSTSNSDNTIVKASEEIMKANVLGPIVFVTPEIGRWSTVGGLGVMVDELTQGLADINEDVYVITTYYNKNRKGETGYLAKDSEKFTHLKNIEVKAAGANFTLGVHIGTVNKVKLVFLHNAELYPTPYPDMNVAMTLRQIVVFAKAVLQYLCSEQLIPSLIVTNDWFTALTAAYAKSEPLKNTFKETTFLHIFHNLQESYEGRLYTSNAEGGLEYIHGLDSKLLMDRPRMLNPSRCAILCSDQWATVSQSYKQELLAMSSLAPLLSQHPRPFAFPNGIPIKIRLQKMKAQVGTDHFEAKRELQKKYFKLHDLNDDIPILSFVGRVTSQKGVHLICDAAEQLIRNFNGKINILVGGPANRKDPYAASCATAMENLARKFPNSFWAAPDEFFTDGFLIDLGSDFGMMPSAFEPGGIVQHEFFVGGTPVIAFKTGGLKDSVFEYNPKTKEGNGMVFEVYNRESFSAALERAMKVFLNKGDYAILRKNAFKSTMDGVTVAKEWCKEFYRLRGKFFADQCSPEEIAKIPSEWNYEKYNEAYLDQYIYESFINPNKEPNFDNKLEALSELVNRQKSTRMVIFKFTSKGKKPETVELCGSFSDWKTRFKMSYDALADVWYITMHLQKGSYTFKYVVDGNWVCDQNEKIIKGDKGELNNEIVIE